MPTLPGSSIRTGSHSDGSPTAENQTPLWTGEESTNQRQVTSIDALPDDVLLLIFASYLQLCSDQEESSRAWQSLVHVCRRWRSVVFGSPRRLDLRLLCTESTRSRDMLNIWPALPLIIYSHGHHSTRSLDNIVAALECSDRVCHIMLEVDRTSDLKIFLAAMQQPFPELTHLRLWSTDEPETVVLPNSFLGGFAPRLEVVHFFHLPFLGLPKLLLSATHLVDLRLFDIPHSGYISPDAVVAALSTLISLEYLSLTFESPESCPDQASRRPPPSTRSVLPVLTYFHFKGVSEYLEDLVTDIDAPQLRRLWITFFNDSVLDTPELIRFLSRTPMSSGVENAHIVLKDVTARVSFQPHHYGDLKLDVSVLCEGLDWQLSSLEQVCTSCLPFISTLKHLYILEYPQSQPDWKDNIENRVWLDLLHRFIAVKNLYISEKIALSIGPALQEGRTTGVLPTLENIFLEGQESSGPVQEGIGQFVAARQASHPVTISRWAISGEEKALINHVF